MSANQCRGSICEVHHDGWRLAICCRSCRGHVTAQPNSESGAASGSSASRSGQVSTMLQGTVQGENVSYSQDQGAKAEPPESIKPGHQGQMQHGSFFLFLSVRLLLVLRGQSFFSSPPQQPMTSDFKGFSIPDFIHYIYFPIFNS